MNGRRPTLAVVVSALVLPLLLAAVGAVSFYARNADTDAITVDGVRRTFLLHLPDDTPPAAPAPLVISLHAAALWGAAQRDVSGWDAVADAHGFIVAYPSGATGHGPRVWAAEHGASSADVRFIAALIDTVSARYRIDPSRIYVNGLSNGGGMSFALSCLLSHRIAAVGVVAAAQNFQWRDCPRDARPVPVIAFHGTADPVVPFAGGASWTSPQPFPDVRRFVARWAARNRCAAVPDDSRIAPSVERLRYETCSDDATVELYALRGAGHVWPGGGALPEWLVGRGTDAIDATGEMWRFFAAHPRKGVAPQSDVARASVFPPLRDSRSVAKVH